MKKNLYDKVVFFYDRLAMTVLGTAHKESKYAFLDRVSEGDQVLCIGGGTGENLPVLANKVGRLGKVYFVEASQKMMGSAKSQLTADLLDRVVFLHQTDFSVLPNQLFDWIITQYLLDILSDKEIDSLFLAIKQREKPSAHWILVDFFDQPAKRWLQWIMIRFFRLTTGNPRNDLPKYHQFFEKHGWKLREEENFKGGWIKAACFKKV
ncbi:methyltransferase domain-containing protein [Echinicola soli]|uniref:Methyltransferase domain-containing protein n=1 Tax=Echinicola soli TaxID=2591634 RepID=A0A514CEN6_9BACT|nr:methyltransferase domain-containing protein [Echinicola soli]QDH78114.1 methyltransferase domain-containing protein [Echinicola soli]